MQHPNCRPQHQIKPDIGTLKGQEVWDCLCTIAGAPVVVEPDAQWWSIFNTRHLQTSVMMGF